MHTKKRQNAGFTLIETLIVLALMIGLSIIALENYQPSKGGNDLKTTAQNIAATLRQAQSRSSEQLYDQTWAVYFSNTTATQPFYALLSSSTYSSGTVVSQYILPKTVAYISSTLPSGSTTLISFSLIAGLASASKSIGIYDISYPTLSSTISVASSGEVSF